MMIHIHFPSNNPWKLMINQRRLKIRYEIVCVPISSDTMTLDSIRAPVCNSEMTVLPDAMSGLILDITND